MQTVFIETKGQQGETEIDLIASSVVDSCFKKGTRWGSVTVV